jgi:adenosylcobinamide-GDP ribazoletransferase
MQRDPRLTDDLTPRRPPRQDNDGNSHRGSRLTDDLVMGLRFFSRLPVGDRPHELPDMSRMARAAPFTSLVIGLGPALLLMAAAALGVPGYFAAALAVGAMVVVSGAMPEDALADAADGLFGGRDIEQRLDIMKDSRHGSYGVSALGLYLILRVAALGALAIDNPLEAGCVWLAATIIGRSGAMWLAADLPAAREGGASATAGRVSRTAFVVGAVFATVLAFVLAGPFVGVLGLVFGALAAAGVAWGWTWACRRLLGGQTGDVIGALHALIEIAVLTAFLVFG